MSTTSSRDDLARRLRRRLESERRQIEDLTTHELRRLGENLSAAASAALRSIESDTAEAAARMRALLLRAWLRPLVAGLSLFIGFSGGSWATMHWLSRSIREEIEILALANRHIEDARQTLARLETDTWGIVLREIRGDRFVVLPAGTLDDPPWTVRGRPAVKLSRE